MPVNASKVCITTLGARCQSLWSSKFPWSCNGCGQSAGVRDGTLIISDSAANQARVSTFITNQSQDVNFQCKLVVNLLLRAVVARDVLALRYVRCGKSRLLCIVI